MHHSKNELFSYTHNKVYNIIYMKLLMLYMTANVTNMYISGYWWGIQVFVSPYPPF